VSPEDIESWEFGDAVPSLPQLELLAYYLGVPVSHFWGSTTLEAVQGRHVDVQTEYMALRDRMVGALLRQAREETNLSIEELAKEGGVSPDELRAYELGEVPLPFHELNALAGIVRKNVSYFLESSGHFGELLSAREQWKHFSGLREDLREFAANPRNIGFIEIALMLSQMPVDQLRSVGASILEITR
jgi:transcriptional regulator with XRE-family HTH domain